MTRSRERVGATIEVIRAPRVRIDLFGDDEVRRIRQSFVARHPRLPIFQRKRWGIALLRLPERHSDYLSGRARQAVRTNCNKASRLGYRHVTLAPADHIDEIVEINRSEPIRQGRPMREGYLDRASVAESVGRRPMMHGVVDRDGRLRAYAVGLDLGDAILIATILGHADSLDDGVMYLLVSEMVRSAISMRRPDGSPHWLMYDTFWGAKSGLAYFKRRLGFEPYTVDWRFVEGSRGAPSMESIDG